MPLNNASGKYIPCMGSDDHPGSGVPSSSHERGNPPTTLTRAVDYFWLGKRWELDDDRGVRVRVFMPDVLAARESDLGAGVISPSEYRALKKEILRRLPAASKQLRVLARIFIVLLVAMIVWHIANGPWHIRAVIIDLLLLRVLPLVMLVLTLRSVGDSPKSVREVFIARRRCTSCGFDLAGQPTESDGCTVCPECAAAWRL